MGSLSAAALLAKKGLDIQVFEQNYLPGGCTTSYWRKGFVFEAGATTLVGLDEHMSLKYVLEETGIEISARKLDLPMLVHLPNGETISRFQDIEQWINEAERVFGKKGQRAFWTDAYQISQFVWKTSLKQKSFPPTSFSDLISAVKNVELSQIKNLPSAFLSVDHLLRKYGLHENELFIKFVNEQLMITAQNTKEEVNWLFGATALCYTNYGNYYIDGGLLNLVNPFVKYIESKGGEVLLREGVTRVEKLGQRYKVITTKGEYTCDYLISGLPINNTFEIYQGAYQTKLKSKLMESKQLNSAFQMGIGFKSNQHFGALHHQIHLTSPLAETGSDSIFISLSHEDDGTRCDAKGQRVMSISTHIPDPENRIVNNEIAEAAIIQILEERGFLRKEDIVYQHSSTPKSWSKWTGRKWGFVGGYPQYLKIKPWQMLDARLDGHKAYLVGDTAYPGQGIPGVTLSGIIAVEKMSRDWGLYPSPKVKTLRSKQDRIKL
ncbi:MAG: amine oxidase [Cytophagales bacterium CG12_big_fil_rev_8_21_14_0_65_40_12]|nr:MAG: amine oxidase [Cytophagales bacterium CG12_big_fil_rev_8_21_14_0_65_40_12]PIW05311.1 MAG: amine oxidase [Cytophagales bacterium CG17_big_fil_post_rev_8_21_14_2_50_40_13]